MRFSWVSLLAASVVMASPVPNPELAAAAAPEGDPGVDKRTDNKGYYGGYGGHRPYYYGYNHYRPRYDYRHYYYNYGKKNNKVKRDGGHRGDHHGSSHHGGHHGSSYPHHGGHHRPYHHGGHSEVKRGD